MLSPQWVAGNALRAADAPNDATLQGALDVVREAYDGANIEIGEVRYLDHATSFAVVELEAPCEGGRLFELAEAPPQYLKFDRRFVTGLHSAPITRQRLVSSLVAAARELLVKTIAEGVEDQHEAEACERAGFSYGQGYHFARPMPIEKLA